MKYIKTYEKVYNEYDVNVGDFIITKKASKFENSKTEEIKLFTNSNIGEVIDKYKHHLLVKYENIPSKIQKYFKNNILKIKAFYIQNLSKNKEELETLLKTKKYNL